MAVELTWLAHASFRIAGSHVVYIDPWKLADARRDGDLVIISHEHYDHLSAEDVEKVAGPNCEILASRSAAAQLGRGHAAAPGEKVTLAGVQIETIPSYNPAKKFHPRAAGGLGIVVTMDGARIYYAGDTDLIDEMGQLRNIDVALLPIGGTYTMNANEAAEAARRIAPAMAIPYHFGDIVGSADDAAAFAEAAPCKVQVLKVGETTTVA